MKKIAILSILLCFCFLTAVSAADNSTSDVDFEDVLNAEDSSEDMLSVGESPDNPVNDADQLYSKYFSIPQSSTANIYLAEGNYSFNNRILDFPVNVTFIGQGEKTVLKGISTQASPGTKPSELNYAIQYSFVNLTFVGGNKDLSRGCKFINCTIIDSLTFSKDFQDNPDKLNIRHITQDTHALRTYFHEFDNCVFKNFDKNSSYLTMYQFARVTFNNCKFTNISADSIICYACEDSAEKFRDYLLRFGWDASALEKISYDGIYFNNCLFDDSKYTAVTDAYAAISRNISGCNDVISDYYGVFVSDDGIHHYYSLPIPEGTVMNVSIADSNYGESFIINVDFNNRICDEVVISINKEKYTVSVINGTGAINVSSDLDAGVWNFQANSLYNNFNMASNFTVNKLATEIFSSAVSSQYNGGKYLTVSLKDANGNALKNALISIKIGSKSYSQKTNGASEVKIKTDGLKPNVYKAVIAYGGNDNYLGSNSDSKVAISKAAPKITAKKATFKIKTKIKKYSIVLKDNKNKVMKNAKVTLKVKGKTFKASTNAKGKATFKITKLTKKGTYSAVIKFQGNACYKSVSKKASIKIK